MKESFIIKKLGDFICILTSIPLKSYGNFSFSFGTALVFDNVFKLGMGLLKCVAIGVLAVGVELIFGFGLDNIATTLTTSILAYCFVYVPYVNHYIIPILLTPYIVIIVNSKKVLTKSGLLAALILDLIISN